MKRTLFTLLVSLTFSNLVTAQTIAELPVKLGFDSYAMAQLDDNRELIITTQKIIDPTLFSSDVLTEETVRVPLNDALYTRMLFDAIQLSNAKLNIHRAEIVCMMVAPPGPTEDLSVLSGYDRERGFLGEMRQVLTQRGCWAHVHVAPKHEHLKLVAHRLVGQLSALTHQALSSN